RTLKVLARKLIPLRRAVVVDRIGAVNKYAKRHECTVCLVVAGHYQQHSVLSPRLLRLLRQPDYMPCAASGGAGTNGDFLDRKPGVAQAGGEAPVGAGGPHGQDAAGGEGGVGGGQARRAVEGIVAVAAQAFRAVVD